MAEHELEKLLGGFAADQLTPEERTLLFTAALHDQQLFNALADEQALKELLADPAVRRRLLQSLQTKQPDVGGSRTWLEWFRRPTGLAWAYGLAAAVFAVVLGTRIYQDSLRQAAQSVATEETPAQSRAPVPLSPQPVPPQAAAPQSKAQGNAAPATAAKKDAPSDGTTRPERSAPSKPQEPPSSDAARDMLRPSGQDVVRQQDHAPKAGSGQAQEERADSARQTPPATGVPPPAAAQGPSRLQGLANAPAALRQTAPALSARALFYSRLAEPASEQEGRSQSAVSDEPSAERLMAEAPLKEGKRAERRAGSLGKLERASTGKPLGVRYSLIMGGPGGIDMEVDPATPIGKDDLPRLAIQTTEQGYLYIVEEQTPGGKRALLFPASGDARITGRATIPVALSGLFHEEPASRQVRLLLLFSRTPQDVVSGIPSVKQASPLLIEQVDPGQPGAAAEQAVYVMSRDPSLTLLSVDIPLSLH